MSGTLTSRCLACNGATWQANGRRVETQRVLCTNPACVFHDIGLEVPAFQAVKVLMESQYRAGYQTALHHAAGKLNELEKYHGHTNSDVRDPTEPDGGLHNGRSRGDGCFLQHPDEVEEQPAPVTAPTHVPTALQALQHNRTRGGAEEARVAEVNRHWEGLGYGSRETITKLYRNGCNRSLLRPANRDFWEAMEARGLVRVYDRKVAMSDIGRLVVGRSLSDE